MLGGKQSSLLLLGKAETDLCVALTRLRLSSTRMQNFREPEQRMLEAAAKIVADARDALRALQPLPLKDDTTADAPREATGHAGEVAGLRTRVMQLEHQLAQAHETERHLRAYRAPLRRIAELEAQLTDVTQQLQARKS